MTAAADRHLLFGLLALQNGLIDQGQLVAAFQAWTRDKSKSLADHLEARGDLTATKRALLEALAEVHLEAHAGDAEKSLAAVSANRSTRARLVELGEPEIEATLARVTPAKSGQATEFDDDPDRTATLSVGGSTSDGQRFRLLRPHARGGLGEVFVALDAELHREVALKQILDAHADDLTSRARFVLEAEITGGLEHPGIVPVYGLGAYGDGRPYYAMRFIRGDSLKVAIARFRANAALRGDPGRHTLELRKVLRRLLDVCNAIEYAHSRGVLHRDIKPANIILGKYGETLVVDWGLAKATGSTDPGLGERPLRPGSASGSAETLPGSALGTPAYMSPEQATGDLERLGPRSDVYSLGATLYCLLTGKPPFQGDDLGTVLRGVQKGDFRPPRELDPMIDRALEAVCLNAMEVRPEGRYASPKELAEDLERWMADEPVSAWREPWADRVRRRMKRHRTALAAMAGSSVVAILALSTIATLEGRTNGRLAAANLELRLANERAEHARNRAEESFRQGRQTVNQFFTRVSQERLLNQPGLHPLRRALLQDAQRFYEDFLSQHGDDLTLRAELAGARARVAGITGEIGSLAQATAQFDRAIALWEDLVAAQPDNPTYRAELAGTLNEQLIVLMRLEGRRTEALRTFRHAQDLLEPLVTADPRSAPGRHLLGPILANIAQIRGEQGQPEEAIKDLQRLIGIESQLAVEDRRSLNTSLTVAVAHARLGHILVGQPGGSAPAIASLQRAVEIREAIIREHPGLAEESYGLANDLGDLSALQQMAGELDSAEKSLHKALEIHERLSLQYPGVLNYQGSLAVTYNMMSDLHRRRREPAEALALAQKARSLLERLVSGHPEDTMSRIDLAKSYNNIGRGLQQARDPTEALRAFRRAVDLYEGMPQPDPRNSYNLACNLALCIPLLGARSGAQGTVDVAKLNNNDQMCRVYGDRAIDALRRAIRGGFLNREIFQEDTDLDPIRERSDFQVLLMDMDFPVDPFAR
jgi:eukaryotic-like serine/threonine-protein kinase